MDEPRAPDEDRRRVPAHRHRHGAGDRAECVLRVPSTFPTNNAIANLLLGAPVVFYQGLGEFRARNRRVGCSARYAQDEWRVTSRAHPELRIALRADQPVHRGPGSLERVRARRAVAGEARCTGGSALPGRSRRPAWNRAERQRLHAAGRGRVGSDRNGHVGRESQLWPLLRSVPERIRHGVAGRHQRDTGSAVRPVQRRGV